MPGNLNELKGKQAGHNAKLILSTTSHSTLMTESIKLTIVKQDTPLPKKVYWVSFICQSKSYFVTVSCNAF